MEGDRRRRSGQRRDRARRVRAACCRHAAITSLAGLSLARRPRYPVRDRPAVRVAVAQPKAVLVLAGRFCPAASSIATRDGGRRGAAASSAPAARTFRRCCGWPRSSGWCGWRWRRTDPWSPRLPITAAARWLRRWSLVYARVRCRRGSPQRARRRCWRGAVRPSQPGGRGAVRAVSRRRSGEHPAGRAQIAGQILPSPWRWPRETAPRRGAVPHLRVVGVGDRSLPVPARARAYTAAPPLQWPESPAAEAISNLSPLPFMTSPPFQHARILIVDDEDANVEILRAHAHARRIHARRDDQRSAGQRRRST